MMKIDAFAHILTPDFYQTMLKIDATIPQKYPFIRKISLEDLFNKFYEQLSHYFTGQLKDNEK